MKPKLFKARGRIVTDILGRSKYTTYTEALNEAVANSLDWDAKNIWVRIGDDYIEIEDDGCGMSPETLIKRYFGLGEETKDPEKRAQFGIGMCANAALGNLLEIETHEKGKKFGTRAVVNFFQLEKSYLGEYEPEEWNEKVPFDPNHHGTKIKVKWLRWRNIDQKEIEKYLIQKHWVVLIDPEIDLSIHVGESLLKAGEPKYDKKYEFDSLKKFRIGKKFVPALPELSCGRVSGVFYIIEDCEEPSVDVYAKKQRLDAYSGVKMDWLGIRNLRSPKGFQSELKGIIKVEATIKTPEEENDPLFLVKTSGEGLIIKSDRSRFFENTRAFEHLCAYLNEKANGPILNLPHGGILRLINDEWYREKAADYKKNISAIEKEVEKIKPELEKVLKGAEIFRRISEKGMKKEKPRKLFREKEGEEKIIKRENVWFICSQCGKINRIPMEEYKKWEEANYKEKKNIEKDWKCKACGNQINPLKDRYKRESPQAKSGKLLAKIDLGIGKLKEIKADLLGEKGPRAVYYPEDEVVKINAQHSLLVYAHKTSDEAFRVNLLDSVILAISIEYAEELKKDFQLVYNELCANIKRIVDVSAYEEALEKFIS